MDPYAWRESVLSTRSLSYLSTADTFGPQSRRGTLHSLGLDSDADDDLMMAGTGNHNMTREEIMLDGIPELPENVAESLLFRLPREIRDRIYAFALTSQDLPVEWPPLPGMTLKYGIQAQLLRTCRIMHREAAPLLYSSNRLMFHHPSDANMFVRALADPVLARKCVQHVSLQIKAGDTRLWMPFLTSTREERGLKADFPGLRQIEVRYRGNRWNQHQSIEQNLQSWNDDMRLGEIVDGLRNMYLIGIGKPLVDMEKGDRDSTVLREERPETPQAVNEMNAEEFMRFIDARKPGEDMDFKRQLLELHIAHMPPKKQPLLPPPIIKVTCACRVSSTHFNLLTGTTDNGFQRLPHPAAFPPGTSIATVLQTAAAGPVEGPIRPVKAGDGFTGFTLVDFQQSPPKKLYDPDLGSAKVARTVFADKQGVGLALEVHCLDAVRKEGGVGVQG
ncbi:hypothetical protein Tdes44962_MAKER00862 [Teratosphaeria destructans]|uniref:F-box domain-containing protein n=1 Tax=Teratosphaeria destructans TaxID=418781 RepID=A0A9W7SKK3_9PEZI|nr:hypothetical protein Tdes44962_MAKER00862 [Teratosphaeria destructans]